MNVQEALNELVAFIDIAIKQSSVFGVNETKLINDIIGVLNSAIKSRKELEDIIESKNEAIKRLIDKEHENLSEKDKSKKPEFKKK